MDHIGVEMVRIQEMLCHCQGDGSKIQTFFLKIKWFKKGKENNVGNFSNLPTQ